MLDIASDFPKGIPWPVSWGVVEALLILDSGKNYFSPGTIQSSPKQNVKKQNKNVHDPPPSPLLPVSSRHPNPKDDIAE